MPPKEGGRERGREGRKEGEVHRGRKMHEN